MILEDILSLTLSGFTGHDAGPGIIVASLCDSRLQCNVCRKTGHELTDGSDFVSDIRVELDVLHHVNDIGICKELKLRAYLSDMQAYKQDAQACCNALYSVNASRWAWRSSVCSNNG